MAKPKPKSNANDRGPAGNTAPKTSPLSIPAATQSRSSGSSGGSLSSAVRNVGPVLSKSEATSIAKDTGKTAAQVMAKAQNAGVAIGSAAVNAYSKGTLGPNASNTVSFGGLTAAPGYSQGTARAIQALAPLQNLQMGKGTAYYGASQYNNPGGTVYNPIVLPRDQVAGRPAVAAPVAVEQQTQGPVGQWEQSVENSNQALIDSINAQIAANAAQAELYMGQMNDFMMSMQDMMKPASQSITPYAVTTSSVAPATGAQTTSSIAPRKKPTDTDLSISPLVADLSGTGLNIGI